MSKPHIWLRAETKPFERRTPLTPQGAKQLIDDGYKVTVEDSEQSIFSGECYQQVGCDIASPGSWQNADPTAYILALKELPEDEFNLIHRHIYFAHAYKEQQGWQQLLGRFKNGQGQLFDLEYLVDDNQRRIAAFGYWAGFAGAALGVIAWANQQLNITPSLAHVQAYDDKQPLFDDIQAKLEQLKSARIPLPKVMVIGALGRSGTGACDLAAQFNLEVIKWDMAETAPGGPFEQINQADVMVNCVFVQQDLPPFTTKQMVAKADRKLSMIVDVSCDPYSSFNPLPIYHQCTTFDKPCLTLDVPNKPLELIAIDHLPSLLPKESSEDYSGQLLKQLRLIQSEQADVWHRALALFGDKTALL